MIVRVTGLLVENGKILLLDQDRSGCSWSLPGGKVDPGESLEKALIREMKEETGLEVAIGDLVYLCDFIKEDTHVLHITFIVSKTGGTIGDIAIGHDSRKIRSVEMVDIKKLAELGFSQEFQDRVQNDFPDKSSYMGAKSNIGL